MHCGMNQKSKVVNEGYSGLNQSRRDEVNELLLNLRKLSPLPSDEDVSQQCLDEYKQNIYRLEAIFDDVIRNKNWEVLPSNIGGILLDSVGTGDGYGLYLPTIRILEGLFLFSPYSAITHEKLRQAVANRLARSGSRDLALQVLRSLALESDLDLFVSVLQDEKDDRLLFEALIGVRRIGATQVIPAIEKLFDSPSNSVRKVAHDVSIFLKDKERNE